jgi:hypothetical protein
MSYPEQANEPRAEARIMAKEEALECHHLLMCRSVEWKLGCRTTKMSRNAYSKTQRAQKMVARIGAVRIQVEFGG